LRAAERRGRVAVQRGAEDEVSDDIEAIEEAFVGDAFLG